MSPSDCRWCGSPAARSPIARQPRLGRVRTSGRGSAFFFALADLPLRLWFLAGAAFALLFEAVFAAAGFFGASVFFAVAEGFLAFEAVTFVSAAGALSAGAAVLGSAAVSAFAFTAFFGAAASFLAAVFFGLLSAAVSAEQVRQSGNCLAEAARFVAVFAGAAFRCSLCLPLRHLCRRGFAGNAKFSPRAQRFRAALVDVDYEPCAATQVLHYCP